MVPPIPSGKHFLLLSFSFSLGMEGIVESIDCESIVAGLVEVEFADWGGLEVEVELDIESFQTLLKLSLLGVKPKALRADNLAPEAKEVLLGGKESEFVVVDGLPPLWFELCWVVGQNLGFRKVDWGVEVLLGGWKGWLELLLLLLWLLELKKGCWLK